MNQYSYIKGYVQRLIEAGISMATLKSELHVIIEACTYSHQTLLNIFLLYDPNLKIAFNKSCGFPLSEIQVISILVDH